VVSLRFLPLKLNGDWTEYNLVYVFSGKRPRNAFCEGNGEDGGRDDKDGEPSNVGEIAVVYTWSASFDATANWSARVEVRNRRK